MLETCTICGAIFDPAVADHYAWHATRDEYPPEPAAPDPEPEPETPEEAPDGNVGT